MKTPAKSSRGRKAGQVKAESVADGFDGYLYGAHSKNAVDLLSELDGLPGYRDLLRRMRRHGDKSPQFMATAKRRFRQHYVSLMARMVDAVRNRDWQLFRDMANRLQSLQPGERVDRAADRVRFALHADVTAYPELKKKPMTSPEIMERLAWRSVKCDESTARRAAKAVGIKVAGAGRPKKQ